MSDSLRFFQLSIIAVFLSLSASLDAKESNFYVYEVERGDTITEILYKHKLLPIYGDNQRLKQFMRLNRFENETVDKIFPGDKLIIPLHKDPEKNRQYTINSNETTDSERDKIEDGSPNIENLNSKDKNLVSEVKSSESIESGSKLPHEPRVLTGEHSRFYSQYFYRNYAYEGGGEADIDQNVVFGLQYRDKKPKNFKFGWKWALDVDASILLQSNADFNQNSGATAEFSPSFFVNPGISFLSPNLAWRITPYLSYSYFSLIDVDNLGFFNIRKDQTYSLGLNIRRYLFRLGKTEFDGAVDLKEIVQSDKVKGERVATQVRGTTAKVSLLSHIGRHNSVEVFYRIQELQTNKEISSSSAGISGIYRY